MPFCVASTRSNLFDLVCINSSFLHPDCQAIGHDKQAAMRCILVIHCVFFDVTKLAISRPRNVLCVAYLAYARKTLQSPRAGLHEPACLPPPLHCQAKGQRVPARRRWEGWALRWSGGCALTLGSRQQAAARSAVRCEAAPTGCDHLRTSGVCIRLFREGIRASERVPRSPASGGLERRRSRVA